MSNCRQHLFLIFICLPWLSSQQAEVKHVLQKFDLSQAIKPVKDRVEEFGNFLAVLYHPNFGGVSYLNPSYFWEKLKEKREFLLPSAHVAIFGNGQPELHDYPFAYRKSKAEKY